ncbi:MAG: LL-diaminopimelate aminotransferase [bacterium]
MLLDRSLRLKSLPEYPFARIDRLKKEAKVDIIDLGIGDPDLPTPEYIISALKNAIDNPITHQYPPYSGYSSLRCEIASWYKKRFDVDLNPDKEILPLLGSKEGIAHILFSIINPCDYVLTPDPGYPVYKSATILSGGIPRIVPLLSKNGFLPDLDNIDPNGCKAFFLNYPNNPTGATCSLDFLKDLVHFARKNNIIILFDLAYSEVYFDEKPPSLLQIDGGMDVGIEFHSFSKTYNMAGWRLGFCVGNRDIIKSLLDLKTNLDSGIFGAIQYAGISALKNEGFVDEMRKVYKRRLDILTDGLSSCGFKVDMPKATFYLWASIKGPSLDFSEKLLKDTGVVATPGIGFGKYGEGFIRFSVASPDERIKEAVSRIKKWHSFQQ